MVSILILIERVAAPGKRRPLAGQHPLVNVARPGTAATDRRSLRCCFIVG
jgi:hypothetical protein